ncbi:MAG: peptidase MA family metallohydrolase [Nitrospiria bacterium]
MPQTKRSINRPAAAWLVLVITLCGGEPGTRAAFGDATVETTHAPFVFRYVEADRPLVQALEGIADRAWARVTADLGHTPPAPITVVLAHTDHAFNQFQPPDRPLPAWASGVAYPEVMTMVIRSYHAPGSPRQDAGTIFVHELTHLVLGARFGNQPAPRWLHEGVAMYEAGEWRPQHEWALVRAVLGRGVPPLDELTRFLGRTEADAATAYLLSEALIGHMIATYGRPAFADFVARLAEGNTFEDALISVFGVSESRFEARWRAHLDRRYTWIPLITSTSALWVVMMAVAFVAYAVKRRRNRKIVGAWEEEERKEGPPTE